MEDKQVIMIGVAGDSASGKATFGDGIQQILGTENVTTISLDNYHSMDRMERRKKGVTPLDPRCNHMRLIAEQARKLKQGETIKRPTYDHRNGTFGPFEEVVPKQLVVMTGLLPFMEEEMRTLFDFKVFLDPHEELKLKWKMDRDTAKRGYTAHQLNAEVQARKRDFERFVKPQKSYADLIIRFYPAMSLTKQQPITNAMVIQKRTTDEGSGQNLAWICNEIKGIDVHNDVDPLVLEISEQVEGKGIQMMEEQIVNGTDLLDHPHESDWWTQGTEKTGLQMCQLLVSWLILSQLPDFDEVALDGSKRVTARNTVEGNS
jgi:phosphoribulokinase